MAWTCSSIHFSVCQALIVGGLIVSHFQHVGYLYACNWKYQEISNSGRRNRNACFSIGLYCLLHRNASSNFLCDYISNFYGSVVLSIIFIAFYDTAFYTLFFKHVLLKDVYVLVLSSIVPIILHLYLPIENGLFKLLIICFASALTTILSIYCCGCDPKEKAFIRQKLSIFKRVIL